MFIMCVRLAFTFSNDHYMLGFLFKKKKKPNKKPSIKYSQ